jgi:Fe-S-cluster-containing dehydrogenase component
VCACVCVCPIQSLSIKPRKDPKMLHNIKGQANLVQAHERSSKAMLEHRMKTFKTQIVEQTTQQSSQKEPPL